MNDDVVVVILAGGEGNRMGGGKPLKQVSGERLIDRAVRHARRWSDAVAVAVREAHQAAGVEAEIVFDDPNVAGPLAGLIAALKFGAKNGREFVLAIPADMPFLPDELLAHLLEAIDGKSCALASSGGQLHPVCGLWRAVALERTAAYLATQRRSLRAFGDMLGFVAVEWPAEPLDPFFNINTAADLARAERRLAS